MSDRDVDQDVLITGAGLDARCVVAPFRSTRRLFSSPKLCVQVKSLDSAVDARTLRDLVGTTHNFGAQHGLLVSWGGFNKAVQREVAGNFFEVRLWDQDALIQQLLDSYERHDADIRAELPLKRIWAMTLGEDEPE